MPRQQSAGFQVGPPLVSYWLTQTKIFWMYLKLAVWPAPLLIHYEVPYLNTIDEASAYVVPLLVLAIVTAILLWRNRPAGYVAAWALAILAPTHVVPIITEIAAERRFYLPLAAVTSFFVVGCYRMVMKLVSKRGYIERKAARARALYVGFGLLITLLVVSCGMATSNRLGLYADEIGMWQHVIQHQPRNTIAHSSLWYCLEKQGDRDAAMQACRESLITMPDFALAHYSLGILLAKSGDARRAVDEFRAAVHIEPSQAAYQETLASALAEVGLFNEGYEHFHEAVRLKPKSMEAYLRFSKALRQGGSLQEALQVLKLGLQAIPDNTTFLNIAATELIQWGQLNEADRFIDRSLEVNPGLAETYNVYGLLLVKAERLTEAANQFQKALQIDPDEYHAHNNLGILYGNLGDVELSIKHFQAAVDQRPDVSTFHTGLAGALQRAGRHADAIEHFRKALEQDPKTIACYAELARAYALADRFMEAVTTAERGISIAQATGQPAAAEELADWLYHFQIELRRAKDGTTTSAEKP